LITKLKNPSEFLKNIITLTTGSSMGQIILIATSPILTRLYTPEEFGILAIYISIVTLIASLAAGRYEYAILKPKKYYEALSLLYISIILISIISIVSFIIVIFFTDQLMKLINLDNLLVLYFIPFSIFITAIYTSFTMWNNKNKNFKLTAYGDTFRSTFISTLQILLSKVNLGLIFGQIIGNFFAVIIISKKFLKNDLKKIKRIKFSYILYMMKKHKDFPIYNMPHMLVTSLKINGTVILISAIYGNTVLGFYSLAMRVLVLPISIVGKSVSQVYYQKISSLDEKSNDIYDLTIKTLLYISIISIPALLVLYFIAPSLFIIVFGNKWEMVGYYVQALIPYMFFMFLLSAISSIPLVYDKQKQYFIWGIAEAISVLSVFGLGNIFNLEIIETLYLLSFIISIYVITIFIWFNHCIKNKGKK
jgi:O-antigen/teichoic acid export membrane protein